MYAGSKLTLECSPYVDESLYAEEAYGILEQLYISLRLYNVCQGVDLPLN